VTRGQVNGLVVSVTALILCGFWLSQISDSAIENDGSQNLQMALNLDREGVMSLDDSAPFAPSMYREPLPVWSTALMVKLVDWLLGPADTDDYFQGPRAQYLKLQNIFWLLLLSASTFVACRYFTSSTYVSLVAVLLLNVRLPMTPSGPIELGFDTLESELPAAALLACGSLFVALAVSRGRLWHSIAAGALFGLLALTKAAMLYVSAGLFLVLLCLVFTPPRLLRHHFGSRHLVAMLAAGAAVVVPWTYRNYEIFGSMQIAQRGGIILYLRAVKNQMTAEEYLGSFYVWAPGLPGPIGAVLGFSEADLEYGGRLQRLNRSETSSFGQRDLAAERAGDPDAAISYYRKARATRVKLERELAAQGVASPGVEADSILLDEGIALIMSHPVRHLVMMIPFIWRGALTTFVVLLSCVAYALYARRADVLFFLLASFGTLCFYALLTHFISRYSVPVVPVAIVAGLVLCTAAWQRRFPTSTPSAPSLTIQ
jgi:hypothetical protein